MMLPEQVNRDFPFSYVDGEELTPAKLVELLDEHIIGQKEAKRAVSIAIRNRFRRMLLPKDLQEEISPKNILLIGPTGVGKTEIARRLAHILKAPFHKVEATSYTEVGYVGKDVENMVRGLVQNSYHMVKQETIQNHSDAIWEKVYDEILNILIKEAQKTPHLPMEDKAHLRRQIQSNQLDHMMIDLEIDLNHKSGGDATFLGGMIPLQNMEDIEINLQSFFQKFGASRSKQKRTLPLSRVKTILFDEISDSYLDENSIREEALSRAENMGIIFIDEMDKIAGSRKQGAGEVSREGVQRDLLPIIEGTSVQTKFGNIRTDHILFIGAGAFHFSKPSDLIPEIQGRFPIRVQLSDLSKQDFFSILQDPKHSLLEQYKALLSTEGLSLHFTNEAIEAMAEHAYYANQKVENIGARRLHTILERVLEDISFDAPSLQKKSITIEKTDVEAKLGGKNMEDFSSNYIL